MSPIQLLFLLSLLIILSFSWKQSSATKSNQKGFNEAYRVNAQLDQWEASHTFPQNQPQNDPNLLKFKQQIAEERKKYAQEWVEKMNNQPSEEDQEVTYYVDSMGRVQYKSNKKDKKKETLIDL